jgi:glycosyltransferase involved in cell wall biosynthesis
MRVTAIVSTYKGAKFIRGCLEDLVAQSLFARGQLEVLVIDAASPEAEGAIAGEFVARFPERFRYVRTPERESLYASWNRGARLARGTYLTNANVDDRHDPVCLEAQADALDAHPEVALVYPDSYITTDANASFAAARKDRVFAWPEFDRDLLFEFCYFGPHPMWRRSLHEEIGYFDETLISAGDYEFWLRIAIKHPCLHLARPLSLYLENPDSISLSNIDLNWSDGEIARDRHWQAAWGPPPKLRRVTEHLARLAQRAERLPADSRIALYGAGKHTQRMLDALAAAVAPRARIVAILDDRPRAAALRGMPVLPTQRWPELGLAAIVISSDTFEDAMAERLQQLLGASLPVWRIYSS